MQNLNWEEYISSCISCTIPHQPQFSQIAGSNLTVLPSQHAVYYVQILNFKFKIWTLFTGLDTLWGMRAVQHAAVGALGVVLFFYFLLLLFLLVDGAGLWSLFCGFLPSAWSLVVARTIDVFSGGGHPPRWTLIREKKRELLG